MSDRAEATKIDEIPDNWKSGTLADIAEIIMGQSPPGESYNTNGKGVPMLNGPTEFTDKHPVPVQYTTIITKLCEPGDILFCVRGSSTGRMNLADQSYCIGRGLGAIRAKKSSVTSFIYYHLTNLADEILRTARDMGSTFPNVNSKELNSKAIPIPPLSEQQKIAEILSTVDEKIYVIDAQISKTTELKKGLMQRLLTKGIGHTQFKDSPLGEIPESWEVHRLESVTSKIGDGLHSTPKYVVNSEWHFINGNNLIDGNIAITEKTKCISEAEFIKHYRDLGDETILMSINGTIGNLAYYKGEKVILGKSAAFISCGAQIDKSFLYYLLQSNSIKAYYNNELTGTTISNLSLKSIRNTPTPLPSKEEQNKIVAILTLVDEKIQVLQESKDNYQELKKGLMQQLLTGKIRVNQSKHQYATA